MIATSQGQLTAVSGSIVMIAVHITEGNQWVYLAILLLFTSDKLDSAIQSNKINLAKCEKENINFSKRNDLIFVRKLDYQWFSFWLVAIPVSSHCLNQCEHGKLTE